MSATDRTTASFEVGAVAHVNFRVRCESLGHGEEIYLVAEEDKGRTKVSVVWCCIGSNVNHGLRRKSVLDRVVYHGRFYDAHVIL
jgi:hypothetical protein